jgi:NADPH2:quinone reductase
VAARVRDIVSDGVAVIVDVNAIANIELDLELLAMGGMITIYAGGGDKLPIPLRAAMGKNARLQFMMTYTVTPEQKHNAVHAVTAAIRDGALRVGADAGLPITRFDLANTADAHAAVEAGAVGKVLIDVADL